MWLYTGVQFPRYAQIINTLIIEDMKRIELIGRSKNGYQVTMFAQCKELKSMHGLCYALVKTVFSELRDKYVRNIPTVIKTNMTWDFIVTEDDITLVDSAQSKWELFRGSCGTSYRFTPSIKKCKELNADQWKAYVHEQASLLSKVVTLNGKLADNISKM